MWCLHELFVVMLFSSLREINCISRQTKTHHSETSKTLRAACCWWRCKEPVCEVQWVKSRAWDPNGKQFDQVKHQSSTGNPTTWPINCILSFCRSPHTWQECNDSNQSITLHVTQTLSMVRMLTLKHNTAIKMYKWKGNPGKRNYCWYQRSVSLLCLVWSQSCPWAHHEGMGS